jgi:hypothetical protein
MRRSIFERIVLQLSKDAVWHEVDSENAVWTIPKERMKRSKAHHVYLLHGFNSDWIEKCLAHEDGRSSRCVYNKAEYEASTHDAGMVGYHRRPGGRERAPTDAHARRLAAVQSLQGRGVGTAYLF